MAETIEEIASRVRELRELERVTAEEMAEYLKVPLETYKCYEEGKTDIPASKLFEIGQRLDVDMNLLLTGEEARMRIFTVTRKGEGVDVERRRQYRYQNLAGRFRSKRAEFFTVTIEPKKEKSAAYSHPGQEFDYVLEGSLKFSIHDHEIVLNEGDSILFDSSYRHSMEARNDRPAKMLVVVI
ncbi:MAG: cupin domain-containing protein [Methanothrix sp.]